MNPFLPLNEYIPDGEAHVFGDRVYLYGSHDAANSKRFCINDYVVYSAKIDELKHWVCHGKSYLKKQDPHSINGKEVDFYAPDCVKGNDGRYYLYYCAMGPNTENFGPISVAVSDKPEGPFEYLGDVRYPDGKVVRDFLTNDPTVLNDEGKIYLYYGWGLARDFGNKLMKPIYNVVLNKLTHRTMKEVKEAEPSILSCAFVELDEDMLTVREKPKAVLDSMSTADKKSELYHHAFYEAPSIRKIGKLYYLVYSSGQNNELAYATSLYPDHGFEYRGVIISNSDLGYEGNKIRKNNASTIHGCIEEINGQYYVFYHRCTNNTDYSRQACCERIEIDETGFIKQVEMTTSGAFEGMISAKGTYNAGLCCNLITPQEIPLGIGKQQSEPRITEKDGTLYLAGMKPGTKAVYKYFDLSNTEKIKVNYTGDCVIKVNGNVLENNEAAVNQKDRVIEIEVVKGNCDIHSFELK
ncbi:MAG: family 43 glycosylhydrolase [Erysipelotrichaceae bacterium]|nr:family 43 glycosylhydrolase [Erysipelotrichaceae bacterium]